MACHRFVTHTTGFATFFGAELAQLHWANAVGMLTVPFFYLAGAMYSAFMIERRISIGKTPHYRKVVATMALILLLVTTAGLSGWFGSFGSELNIRKDYLLLALLCLVSGIQNASITSASGTVLRTTHLTGLTTDLGIGLVSVLSEKNREKIAAEKLKNKIRIGLMASFISGSMLGAYLFLHFEYAGFGLPFFITSTLLYLSHRYEKRKGETAK